LYFGHTQIYYKNTQIKYHFQIDSQVSIQLRLCHKWEGVTLDIAFITFFVETAPS